MHVLLFQRGPCRNQSFVPTHFREAYILYKSFSMLVISALWSSLFFCDHYKILIILLKSSRHCWWLMSAVSFKIHVVTCFVQVEKCGCFLLGKLNLWIFVEPYGTVKLAPLLKSCQQFQTFFCINVRCQLISWLKPQRRSLRLQCMALDARSGSHASVLYRWKVL